MNPADLSVRARAALEAGQAAEAEAAARKALSVAPTAEAWDLLSRALHMQQRSEEAIVAADEALRLAPDARAPLVSRALASVEVGRVEDALRDFNALIAGGVRNVGILLQRGNALLALGRDAQAETAFEEALKVAPNEAALQTALANVRWLRGEGDAFARDYEKAVAANPAHASLRVGCADVLRRAGFAAKAEAMLREGLTRTPADTVMLAMLGMLLTETERSEEAVDYLERSLAGAPDSVGVRAAYVATLLRLAQPEQALPLIEKTLETLPFNQKWLCYLSMAFRQLDDPRYRELCDYDLMVQTYDLSPPPAYRDIGEFNQALADTLEKWHGRAAHPLDQTLRGGSQTPRNLVAIDDPVIQAYLKVLDEPIRAYMDLMQQPGHPWSGRKTGAYRFAGAWSVKLRAGGHHVNHVHPDGWISSSYYVALPAGIADAPDHAGWIKFGEPRWPTPHCDIEKIVEPKPGRLVLFPSYMWHGTIPFEAGERLTAPFDVVPA